MKTAISVFFGRTMAIPAGVFVSGLFVIFNLSSCYRHDPYDLINPGEYLSDELLFEANQIIITDSGLVLNIDAELGAGEYGEYHLFFFDKSMRLRSAAFIPGIRVDSFMSDTFYIDRHYRRKLWMSENRYRQEIPELYTFEEMEPDNDIVTTRSLNRMNKVIDSFKMVNSNTLRVHFRSSDRLYAASNLFSLKASENGIAKLDSVWRTDFDDPQVMEIHLWDAWIECYSMNLRFNIKYYEGSLLIRDYFFFRDENAVMNFYEEIKGAF